MTRVLIIGGPGTGKTTMAQSLGGGRSTDSVMSMGWSEASEEVSHWLDEPYTIIEGVALPRALRKWRDRNPGKPPPCDKIIHLTTVYRNLDPGAKTMTKGMDTVLSELWPWLRSVVK